MGPPLAPTARPTIYPRPSRDTEKPRLHAYPSGSNVALCGKTRKQGEEKATATSYCRTCEGMASSINHRG
jgi:hypothetical protein